MNPRLQFRTTSPLQNITAVSARTWPLCFADKHYRAIGSVQLFIKKEFQDMKEDVKTAWIDENNKIVSFHVIDNGKLIMKAENQFWNFIFGLTNTGYRIL